MARRQCREAVSENIRISRFYPRDGLSGSASRTRHSGWSGISLPGNEPPFLIGGDIRGSRRYPVVPKDVSEETLFSLAHGAGRKWTRLSTRSRIRAKYREEELLRTAIGSRVPCPDRDLLCEEMPDACKNIEQVMQDLLEFRLIDVVAAFRPLLNCKP